MQLLDSSYYLRRKKIHRAGSRFKQFKESWELIGKFSLSCLENPTTQSSSIERFAGSLGSNYSWEPIIELGFCMSMDLQE